MTSPTRTIDRREAAVTAALAGAVLVILGYASGIGIRPQAAASAPAPQVSAPAPSAPLSPAPAAVVPPVMALDPAPAPAARHATPIAPVPSPEPPTAAAPLPDPPAPTTAPAPTAAPSCSPGLVDALVGDLPVVANVTSLLSGLVSSGPLACTLGAIVGPSCCGTEVARVATGATR